MGHCSLSDTKENYLILPTGAMVRYISIRNEDIIKYYLGSGGGSGKHSTKLVHFLSAGQVPIDVNWE